MNNATTTMEAALNAAGVIETAAFDLLTASPEAVETELKKLEAAAAEAAEAAEKAAEAAEKAEEATESEKANFKKATEAGKAAAAVKFMEAAEKSEEAAAASAEAAEKAEEAAEAVREFREAAADVFVMKDFLTAFSAEAANAASAAQIALAYARPEKYLNDKNALQADALRLCRRILGDVIPEDICPSGIFKDNLTVKGALTLCALLTAEKSLTVKEARARFRAR